MGTKWISWTNALLRIRLLIAPSLLKYNGLRVAFWNSLIAGILIVLFALREALRAENPGVSWLLSILGLWVIFSPFLFHGAGFPLPRHRGQENL